MAYANGSLQILKFFFYLILVESLFHRDDRYYPLGRNYAKFFKLLVNWI